LGATTQKPIAKRIDLNIAVERGRLEEGEDFQLALPTAMFFYFLGAMFLAFISTPIDEVDPTKYSHQSRLDENPLRTFFVSSAVPQMRSVGIASV